MSLVTAGRKESDGSSEKVAICKVVTVACRTVGPSAPRLLTVRWLTVRFLTVGRVSSRLSDSRLSDSRTINSKEQSCVKD
jgi:hypothetical protein